MKIVPSTGFVPSKNEFFYPLEQTFNKFFDEFFSSHSNNNVAKSNTGYPKINAYRDDDTFNLSFAVPGVRSDDLEVEYGKGEEGVGKYNTVTIRGRTAKQYHSSEDAKFLLREIRLSSFERTVVLPGDIEGEPQDAVLSDGILVLTWKTKPTQEKNRIKISVKSV